MFALDHATSTVFNFITYLAFLKTFFCFHFQLETNVLMRVKEESKLAEMAEKKSKNRELKVRQMKPVDQEASYGKGVRYHFIFSAYIYSRLVCTLFFLSSLAEFLFYSFSFFTIYRCLFVVRTHIGFSSLNTDT